MLLLSLLLPASALADLETEPWTLNLYFENDLFSESDQNYTNGIRMSWISPDLSSYEKDPRIPKWMRQLNNGLHFFHQLKDRDKLSKNLVFSLGQLMYTPTTIDATELLVDERPYAGFLYSEMDYQIRGEGQLDTVGVLLGVVGPAALGRETQDFIHDLRGFDKFQGWDNQLENEFGLQLVYEHKRRIFSGPVRQMLSHDLIGYAGLSLGNVATYLDFGGEYRIGWQLPDDFGTSAVRPGGDNSAPGRGDPRLNSSGLSGLHVFFSLNSKFVVHDIFLDGNSCNDSHSVDKKPWVGNLASGFSFILGRWKISYAQVFRSKEFFKQSGSHSYGSLSISATW